MADRRKAKLDSLERRLTGPKRIALFGHRAVGKTTLLAMFYREASNGRVPGVRLATTKTATAEYLADKIAQIESGEPPAGTLAETELALRLYHGLAQFDLIVKDYQGEHVSLGNEAGSSIREYFADSDAVLLCLDPSGANSAIDCRRRQQEVEALLEQYIEAVGDGTVGRPVALVVTKYDRVLEQQGPAAADHVEQFVSDHFGMTRHALATHAAHSTIFAVSSYGPGVGSDGRPPATLRPMGLAGPIVWLAEQLEETDRERLEWLWDLAPNDVPRLRRCLKVFEKRYPRSDYLIDYRRRLGRLRRRRAVGSLVKVALGAMLVCAGVAAYDALGYRRAVAYERRASAPALVERRWNEFITWHPTQRWLYPNQARDAQRRLQQSRLAADRVRLAHGIERPDLSRDIDRMKQEAPELSSAIEQVERARNQKKHDQAWNELRVADIAAIEDPEAHLRSARRFLREYPDTAKKNEVVGLIKSLEAVVGERHDRDDRNAVDALTRAAGSPNARLQDLIERGEQFLSDHPESRYRGEIQDLVAELTTRQDRLDIEKARRFSKESPTNFAGRRQRYQDYLRAHESGGSFVSEATAAIDGIDRERDAYLYRLAYDHYRAHPDDVASVASRLRTYLDANPAGRHAADAKSFLAWWERASTPNGYRVVLRRGEVEPSAGKYFAGGAPDLSVELWVGGVKYGPSPVVANSHQPIWEYEFTRPIMWKYGDPITVRILDNDWSASGVFTFQTPDGDKLAMQMLSGTIRPAKGGRTSLTFSSDFRMPRLSEPR